jgi:hypothetical protein
VEECDHRRLLSHSSASSAVEGGWNGSTLSPRSTRCRCRSHQSIGKRFTGHIKQADDGGLLQHHAFRAYAGSLGATVS